MTKRDRERFISEAGRHGIRYEDATKLLRYGATLHRLAEAQCNGDWPADNGERKAEACPLCESLWAPSVICGGKTAKEAHRLLDSKAKPQRACPDCRTSAAASAFVNMLGGYPGAWKADFQGDPRGAVFIIERAGGPKLYVG
jgi:hypothetical protein